MFFYYSKLRGESQHQSVNSWSRTKQQSVRNDPKTRSQPKPVRRSPAHIAWLCCKSAANAQNSSRTRLFFFSNFLFTKRLKLYINTWNCFNSKGSEPRPRTLSSAGTGSSQGSKEVWNKNWRRRAAQLSRHIDSETETEPASSARKDLLQPVSE